MSEISDPKKATASPRPCPICSKPSSFEDRPFCSKRCADIDLHRWLKGSYAIPAAPQIEDDAALSEGEASAEDRD